MRYAKMLAEKIATHNSNAWLLNTGWVGAGASTGGKRCPLKYTRAILDAIHSGELAKQEYDTYETFNLQVPKTCPGVPDELLNPAKSWTGTADFKDEVVKLGVLFQENFKKYADQATPEVIAAGPKVDIPATNGQSPPPLGRSDTYDGFEPNVTFKPKAAPVAPAAESAAPTEAKKVHQVEATIPEAAPAATAS
jgi:phosphoenolpyruvate carboxykinase (ATP)